MVYEGLLGVAEDRAAVVHADVLRAAVVFTHASLENLARSLLAARLPHAEPGVLQGLLAFPTHEGRLERITWRPLLEKWRANSVQEVLDEAVEDYLDRFNLNHPRDLAAALQRIGLQDTARRALEGRGGELETLMKRRHWIVHRLDRDRTVVGRGQFVTESISANTVRRFAALASEIGCIILHDARELP